MPSTEVKVDLKSDIRKMRVGMMPPAGMPRPDAQTVAHLLSSLEATLDRGALAIDGHDLIRELGLEPGPALGRVLDDLLERVILDPALNDRPTLLLLAQASLAGDRG